MSIILILYNNYLHLNLDAENANLLERHFSLKYIRSVTDPIPTTNEKSTA